MLVTTPSVKISSFLCQILLVSTLKSNSCAGFEAIFTCKVTHIIFIFHFKIKTFTIEESANDGVCCRCDQLRLRLFQLVLTEQQFGNFIVGPLPYSISYCASFSHYSQKCPEAIQHNTKLTQPQAAIFKTSEIHGATFFSTFFSQKNVHKFMI